MENRIDELEEKLQTTREVLEKNLEAFAKFSEVTSNSITSLKTAVSSTYQKVDSIYNMLKGY